MRRALLLLVVSLLTAPAGAGPQPVVLSTSHSAVAGIAPLTVRFRAAVDPNEHNRQLCFDWVSDAYSGQGCQTLDGARSPISYWREITFRTGGDFVVTARVERNDDHAYLSNIVVVHVLNLGE